MSTFDDSFSTLTCDVLVVAVAATRRPRTVLVVATRTTLNDVHHPPLAVLARRAATDPTNTDHHALAAHADVAVRRAWASRDDADPAVVTERLTTETSSAVLARLARHAAAAPHLPRLLEHRAGSVVGAALRHPACPDRAGSAAIARYSPTTMPKAVTKAVLALARTTELARRRSTLRAAIEHLPLDDWDTQHSVVWADTPTLRTILADRVADMLTAGVWVNELVLYSCPFTTRDVHRIHDRAAVSCAGSEPFDSWSATMLDGAMAPTDYLALRVARTSRCRAALDTAVDAACGTYAHSDRLREMFVTELAVNPGLPALLRRELLREYRWMVTNALWRIPAAYSVTEMRRMVLPDEAGWWTSIAARDAPAVLVALTELGGGERWALEHPCADLSVALAASPQAAAAFYHRPNDLAGHVAAQIPAPVKPVFEGLLESWEGSLGELIDTARHIAAP